MFRSIRDRESTHFDIAGQGGSFLQSQETAAGKVPGDQAIDPAFVGLDDLEKLDLGSFLNEETLADDLSGDLAMAAENEVTGALDIASEVSLDDEVVTLNGSSKDDSFFENMNVAASLDTAAPRFPDLAILHGDEAATAPALSGIGVDIGGMGVAALEAGHFTRCELRSFGGFFILVATVIALCCRFFLGGSGPRSTDFFQNWFGFRKDGSQLRHGSLSADLRWPGWRGRGRGVGF